MCIRDRCNAHLESRQWAIKHTAAKAVADAVLSITSAVGSENLDKAAAEKIWPVLDKALSGKSWDGKEVVLDAFVRFVERGGSWWKEEGKGARVKELEKVATREAKRKEGANEKVVRPALDKLKEHLGSS